MMQTVLVTGANGFIGYYMVEHLLRLHYNVVATGSRENGVLHQHPQFRYRKLDYLDKEQVSAAFSATQPEVVVHCGAISKPDDCELNREGAFLGNVTGTINLLEEAAVWKAHFIFLSTDFVFSGEKGMYKEEDERNPVNYYGQTKLLAEDEVMRYGYDWSVVRTVLVYGKSYSGKDCFAEHIAHSLQRGERLKIFDDQVRTPTYVEDLAGGIAGIVKKRAAGIFHLSGEDSMTVYQAATRIASFNGLDAHMISPVKEGDLPAPAKRPKLTGLDLTKAKRELGYQPISFAEGLKKTFSLSGH